MEVCHITWSFTWMFQQVRLIMTVYVEFLATLCTRVSLHILVILCLVCVKTRFIHVTIATEHADVIRSSWVVLSDVLLIPHFTGAATATKLAAVSKIRTHYINDWKDSSMKKSLELWKNCWKKQLILQYFAINIE